MGRWKVWLLGAGGVVLPVALVLSAVLISRELNASATVPGLDAQPSATASDREGNRGPGSADDDSGRCSEPEHAAEPTCTLGSGSTGSGSSGGGDAKSTSGTSSSPSPSTSPTREDNSGPGSDRSGSGSGSDDSGSGGDDNSGPGGGDD